MYEEALEDKTVSPICKRLSIYMSISIANLSANRPSTVDGGSHEKQIKVYAAPELTERSNWVAGGNCPEGCADACIFVSFSVVLRLFSRFFRQRPAAPRVGKGGGGGVNDANARGSRSRRAVSRSFRVPCCLAQRHRTVLFREETAFWKSFPSQDEPQDEPQDEDADGAEHREAQRDRWRR
ncbi:hypothetical protein TPHA_0I00770 [Tetrapisispora phaffii CBS 4417]|uniref:Uncharacterized protein n=1 Tax=Tetrapisispora phaffii (strain ATCC 24235 / CBS 4417 / NBRC 1672 / NRRL Y-8282 / UCD 70-5) TaxID=1071381 RepID=G8BXF5_TETPH|nr:hypothetical protein TPHA_0I00770 [Tetrapisispora phaffii CBS 4417]CCE64583.1 hypothetical protein TPHA_0I00770 [Tetrapisispora phaffii CBS 4417]